MGRTQRLAQPESFGRYQLIARLAQGRMGDVYKAKSHGVEGFERILVVKTIHPALASIPAFVDLVVEEAQRAVMLSHANVAQVLNLGKEEGSGTVYIAGEFVNGMDLGRARQVAGRSQTPWPQDLAIFIASEIANGLDYAHRRKDYNFNKLNLIHRDLTPQNVMLSTEGDVKITDFGVGRAMDIIPPQDDQERLRRAIYSAPEVARQEAAYQQSDIYSLGLILLEMLLGQHPYHDPDPEVMIRRAQLGQLPALSPLTQLPRPIVQLLEAMLQADPAHRMDSAGQVYEALVGYIFGNNLKADARSLAVFIQELRKDEDQIFPERIQDDAGMEEISLGDMVVPDSVRSFYDEEQSEAIAEATHDALPRQRLQQLLMGQEQPPHPATSPLPGALEEYFSATRAGQGKAVLVYGQLGAGREYLPDRLCDLLSLRGNTQAFGAQVMLDDQHRPGGALADLVLDATLRQLPQDPMPTRQDALGWLKALGASPEALRLIGALWGMQPLPALGYAQARSLLEDLCQRLIARLCQRATLVLVFDRVEHLDRLTLDLVRAMLSRIGQLPAMIIMSTQSMESMRAMLDTGDPEHLKVVKVVGSAPPKLANTKDLSPDAIAILHTLAVAEQPLSQSDLSRVLGLPGHVIIQSVKELVEFGIVRVPMTGVFMSAIPELVLWVEQRAGRAEIRARAQALVRYVDHHAAHVPHLHRRAPLCRLLARAGERRRMWAIGQQHMEELHRAGFLRVALGFQKTLSELLAVADLGLPQAQIELALERAQLALELGLTEECRAGLAPLSAMCDQVHHDTGAVRAQLLRGDLLMRQDDLEEAYLIYKRAAQAAQALQDPALLVRAHVALAGFYERYGDLLRAQQMLESAQNIASQWGTNRHDLSLRALLLSRAIDVWCARGMAARAGRAVQDLERLAQSVPTAQILCRHDAARARHLWATGDAQGALGALGRAVALAHDSGLVALGVELERQLVSWAIDAQDLRTAQARLPGLIARASQTQDLYSDQRAQELQAFLGAMQGQPSQAAQALLQRALARATQRQIPKDIYRCHSLLELLARRDKRVADAQLHAAARQQLAHRMRFRAQAA